ncbi:MAG: Na+/H+ antiporter NhaC [bacterium]
MLKQDKQISLLHAVVVLAGVFVCISVGLFKWSLSLHVLLIICLLWVLLNTRWLGISYLKMRQMMSEGISQALPAIYIFMLIGLLIAAFMHSGTIVWLLDLGLRWMQPDLFLVSGLVACSVMSVATGTSWGTVGTLGIVLMSIGAAMGVPLPWVAGMVVSGATFGDKLSPVSDTTNLAAMSSGVSLHSHIHSMLYTTVPSFLLVAILFYVMGTSFDAGNLPEHEINQLLQGIQGHYKINGWIVGLPLLFLGVLSFRKFSAEVSMAASIVVAVCIAVVYQEHSFSSVLNALWQNSPGETGVLSLDKLLGRGGLSSMSWTMLLSLIALAMGGVLHAAGWLEAVIEPITKKLHSAFSIVVTTIFSGFAGNLGMGEAYISIILNSQMFKPLYKRMKINRAVLSRSVEEGSTMTTGLIPWTTAGAFYAATLNVEVFDYAPYALFNYLNPLVSMLLVFFGYALLGGKPASVKTH